MTPRFGRALPFLIALGIYGADRVTKILAVKLLHSGQSIKVLPGLFHITLVFNNGAAFGLLKDRAALFICITALAIIAVTAYLWKSARLSRPAMISLGLILGGALGNLVDRVSFGCVIDFLDFRVWPVFNIADSAISVGVVLLIFAAILKKRPHASHTL